MDSPRFWKACPCQRWPAGAGAHLRWYASNLTRASNPCVPTSVQRHSTMFGMEQTWSRSYVRWAVPCFTKCSSLLCGCLCGLVVQWGLQGNIWKGVRQYKYIARMSPYKIYTNESGCNKYSIVSAPFPPQVRLRHGKRGEIEGGGRYHCCFIARLGIWAPVDIERNQC